MITLNLNSKIIYLSAKIVDISPSYIFTKISTYVEHFGEVLKYLLGFFSRS